MYDASGRCCVSATIYTKPGCPYCDAARKDLDERGEPYEEVDITTAPGAADKVAALTGGPVIVPVVVDEKEIRFGFGST